tara:strand:- start:9 stop:203 length:195 start_codon:yes stop_codon:yes gene_type:complete
MVFAMHVTFIEKLKIKLIGLGEKMNSKLFVKILKKKINLIMIALFQYPGARIVFGKLKSVLNLI